MRRPALVLLALAAASPAGAQSLSLDGSLDGTLFGNLNGGLLSGFNGAISGAIGTQQRSRSSGILQSDAFVAYEDTRGFFQRQEYARQGIDIGSCAPGQVDVNSTGCRSIRDVISHQPDSYDTSRTALRPLGNLTLQGATLELSPGPAGPID